MDTEIKLLHWRDGQTKAERLCANILSLEGYSSIDPQCPIGGPDGRKDILCEKNGWKYIGAVYFPTEQKNFKDIQLKFNGDLEGVTKNEMDGIAFLCNQKISPTEREALQKISDDQGQKSIIYHIERIRGILDSPIGFGHRLEYLGIEMTKEDQLSFFSGWGGLFEDMLQKQSDYIISEISKRVTPSRSSQKSMEGMFQKLYVQAQQTMSKLTEQQQPSDKASFVVPLSSPTSDQLNVDLLCMFHRALCFDYPSPNLIGKIRETDVWIARGSNPEDVIYTPPSHDEVYQLTEQLLQSWREKYTSVQQETDRNLILEAIVAFYFEFLKIHPFTDGNGRLSRFLLMQQANELLECERKIILEDNTPYYSALNNAHDGDLEPLKEIITQSLFGEEELTGQPVE